MLELDKSGLLAQPSTLGRKDRLNFVCIVVQDRSRLFHGFSSDWQILLCPLGSTAANKAVETRPGRGTHRSWHDASHMA
jgi:hypothetical protein